MPFEKGMNRSGGREKGTPNKISNELRSMISEFVSGEWESIKEDFRTLEVKERLIYYEKLLAYCIPKNSPVEESEPFAEQPLFLELKTYRIDENTLKAMPYEDLKQLILNSEIFMASKQGKDIILNLESSLDINIEQ